MCVCIGCVCIMHQPWIILVNNEDISMCVQWSALVSILELKLPTNNIKDQVNDNDNIDIASTELYYYSMLIANAVVVW